VSFYILYAILFVNLGHPAEIDFSKQSKLSSTFNKKKECGKPYSILCFIKFWLEIVFLLSIESFWIQKCMINKFASLFFSSGFV